MRAVQPGSLGNGHVDSNLGSRSSFCNQRHSEPHGKDVRPEGRWRNPLKIVLKVQPRQLLA